MSEESETAPTTLIAPQEIVLMRNTLTRAAKQFAFYTIKHLEKEPPDYNKAAINAEYARVCDYAVRMYDEKVEDAKT